MKMEKICLLKKYELKPNATDNILKIGKYDLKCDAISNIIFLFAALGPTLCFSYSIFRYHFECFKPFAINNKECGYQKRNINKDICDWPPVVDWWLFDTTNTHYSSSFPLCVHWSLNINNSHTTKLK